MLVEPRHCLDMTGTQVQGYLLEVLELFSQQYCLPNGYRRLSKFAAQVELDPGGCPLTPCPLNPDA
ncbi:hypothetical protein [Leptolyngbya sp. FACHB-261]|uniref:hypothetical protein n=1 Tax=Leptolyngbya sp. FACHB-261 TaxID=2692806 RepID=UPI00168239AA|nr:hypothetical protein [Leptolyngbya sp. FACHB-261]MBD2100002.1 hypothetical protein [Leptolyngbya sp. FACHB-261]